MSVSGAGAAAMMEKTEDFMAEWATTMKVIPRQTRSRVIVALAFYIHLEYWDTFGYEPHTCRRAVTRV
jgi:hypothetical protein